MMKNNPYAQIEKIAADRSVAQIKKYLLALQNQICAVVEQEDGKGKFAEDRWQYKERGGGLTRVLNNGAVIEKAGVNFSHVAGTELPKAATINRQELANSSFQAMGVSVVIHPLNPYVPTTHLNVRFIIVEKPNHDTVWWFGGGFDLTPYYGFAEDCVHWHREAKKACDPFGDDVYPKYKKWCDQYFYLKHRNEPRGVGGIFFDDLNKRNFEYCFAFMQNVGNHFIKAYAPILARRKQHQYGERERNFQLYRRGRYVEFNLLYDRGTLFGLQSDGRTESILMSLPPLAAWHYHYQPDEGTPEAQLYQEFLVAKDWL